MKKIIGDDLTFFGDGANALLPAGTTFINLNDVSAANQTVALSTTGFVQANAVAVTIGPVASNTSSAANVFTSHSSLAAFTQPESIQRSGGDEILAAIASSDIESGTATSAVPSPETVTTPGSGFVFINTYNSGVTTAYRDAIVAAEHYLESNFTNTVTVRTTFDLQEIDHRFSGENSFSPVHVAYSTFVNALQSHATSADDLAAVAALKNLSDPSGGAGFSVSIGEARALGLAGSGSSTDDTIVLNSFYWTAAALQNSATDATAVLEHELTEGIMGRVGGPWAPMDLFRFTASGHRDFTGGSDGLNTYFSTDGSSVYTGLQYHAATASGSSDGFDWADWDQVGDDANAHDPFGPGGPGVGDPGTLSATDIRIMDVLGWDVAGTTPAGSIAINDMSISEGDSTTKLMTFTVTRSGGSAAFDVNFTTADGSATVADHDYLANSGTLHFNAGVNTQQIQVTINGDPKFESNETFFVNLSGATNSANISDGQGIGTITNDDALFAPATSQLAAFAPAAGGWNSENQYPRQLADVNHDGMADIVGFGQSGVYVSLATGGGAFGAPAFKLAAFAPDAGGWNSEDRYPRELADVNHDGFADIVGFGESGVYVALATGGGNFGTPAFKLAAFAPGAGGWNSQDRYPRHLADVNHDGMADIVGFGQDGVYVALATGGGNFGTPSFKFAAFAPSAGGWNSNDRYPRELADLNNDGMADIVGFGEDGLYVSLATGGGNFATPSFTLRAFAPTAGGWNSDNLYPRQLADINQDGLTDIVGFGQSGVYEALNGFHLT